MKDLYEVVLQAAASVGFNGGAGRFAGWAAFLPTAPATAVAATAAWPYQYSRSSSRGAWFCARRRATALRAWRLYVEGVGDWRCRPGAAAAAVADIARERN